MLYLQHTNHILQSSWDKAAHEVTSLSSHVKAPTQSNYKQTCQH